MVFQQGNKLWKLSPCIGETKDTHPIVKQQSESLKQHWKENEHPKGMLGKNHSKKTKNKMSLLRQGKKNSNWKGGLTEIIRGKRRSPQYYQWRKAVLQRDKNICQSCGQSNCLRAHHIKGFVTNPELQFVINNGIILCENCHIDLHFGRKANVG